MLRHENAVLCRNAGRIRHEPVAGPGSPRSPGSIPRRRWAQVFPMTLATLLAWHRGWRGGHSESADLGRAQERLVAEVVILAYEGLEGTQAVGVSGLARIDFDLEVALEVG